MLNLPDVTLVCIDCLNHASAIKAINKSIEGINFDNVLFLSDKAFYSDYYECVSIDKITSKEGYSNFILRELVNHIDTSHGLIIQFDGYVINPELWNDEWLNYDYIGAPWWYDKHNVGNGGFSLRSKKLMEAVNSFETVLHPEDDFICRLSRITLEQYFDIKFAPVDVAKVFSYEPNHKREPFNNDTFGFHGIPKLIL